MNTPQQPKKLRVLISLLNEAVSQIIMSPMFWEIQSQATERPLTGELGVGIGPKVNELCGTALSHTLKFLRG